MRNHVFAGLCTHVCLVCLTVVARVALAQVEESPNRRVFEIERELTRLGRAKMPPEDLRAAVDRECAALRTIAEKHPMRAVAAKAWSLIAAQEIGKAEWPASYGLTASVKQRNDCYEQSATAWRRSIQAAEASLTEGDRDLSRLLRSAYLMVSYCERNTGDLASAEEALSTLISRRQHDAIAQVRARERRSNVFCRQGMFDEALADARWLCNHDDVESRISGYRLAARCFVAAEPADWEAAAREIRRAVEWAESHVDHTADVGRLGTMLRYRQDKAGKADPRSRTAGFVTILTQTDRSLEYLSAVQQQEGLAVWQERVEQLTAKGRIERGLRDKVTLQPLREGESAEGIARTVAKVQVVPDEGETKPAMLHCTFVREEDIWRLRDIELRFAKDG